MLHRRIGLMRLAVSCLAVLAVSLAGPEPALAKRAANYGIDWTGVGTGEYTRFDAAIRSALGAGFFGAIDAATGDLLDKATTS